MRIGLARAWRGGGGRRTLVPMPMPKATSVEEYRARLTGPAAERFEELYAIVKAAAGDAAEVIKWGTPAFEAGRILYSIAAFKDHLNFVPTTRMLAAFHDEIDALGLDRTKGILQFGFDAPLPADLIRRIAEERARDVRENDAHFGV